jgi:hypothetical protein
MPAPPALNAATATAMTVWAAPTTPPPTTSGPPGIDVASSASWGISVSPLVAGSASWGTPAPPPVVSTDNAFEEIQERLSHLEQQVERILLAIQRLHTRFEEDNRSVVGSVSASSFCNVDRLR